MYQAITSWKTKFCISLISETRVIYNFGANKLIFCINFQLIFISMAAYTSTKGAIRDTK
jgi:hypothetical protein